VSASLSREELAGKLGRPQVSEDALRRRVAELGREITSDYAGRDLVLVTVLKGGFVFMADLVREIDLPLQMDFMAVSSYGPGAAHGKVRITKDLDEDIEDAAVLVVEDIIDTGLTLNFLLDVLRQRKPADLEVCVLLDKDVRRIVDLPIAYRGFSIPDRFVVGYGLDLGGHFRGLPYVATVQDEVMSR
jgi:hypoxanthine phosphoribosyltransferase